MKLTCIKFLSLLIYTSVPLFILKINTQVLAENDFENNYLCFSDYNEIYDDEAPDIKNSGKWINSESDLTLEDLKGSVVLIEFWTFGCFNCTNTLPYLNSWYEKYKSSGFEIIGIHCPEFDNERNFNNVKQKVKELEIRYPVLTDNEFSVWKKFDVHAWPTIFLIDKNGVIRFKKAGEGKYGKTENMIIELLKEK